MTKTKESLLDQVTACAVNALRYEVDLSPKPGLVDRINNGSHHDMTYKTFCDSIDALAPFFKDYVALGLSHQGSLVALFNEARTIGVGAEKAMMQATAGINTHKGANFSFAVILSATGYYLQQESVDLPLHANDVEAIFGLVQAMTADLVEADFANLHLKKRLSYGEKLYLEKGLTGIRGEASAGYPALRQLLLPFLREQRATAADESVDSWFLRGMVLLMSEIEDGNLLHRGGYDAWLTVKEETKHIHQQSLSAEELLDEMSAYDQVLIGRHLSPGGTADLLSLGFYFALLEGLTD